MSARLTTAFAQPPALVAFVTAGDGDTAAILDALVAGGADVIELGMPFTDPMADGPAIQRANLRSLAKGTNTADVFAIASGFRARHPDVPLVLMGYANPMVRRGAEWFAGECRDAGVDGVICVDIPPEEAGPLADALDANALSLIRLATPTTDDARLPVVVARTSGFVYYVSVAGVTGVKEADAAAVAPHVERVRAASGLPVAVGFGIRTPERAAAIARVADAAVVGSALVEEVAAGLAANESVTARVLSKVDSLAKAVRSARVEGRPA